jgi:hypothetical protein
MTEKIINELHELVAQEKYQNAVNLISNKSESEILEVLELIKPNIQAGHYEGNFNAREFSYFLNILIQNKAIEGLRKTKYTIYELQFSYGKSHNAVYATLRFLSEKIDSDFEVLADLINNRVLKSTTKFRPKLYHSALLKTLGQSNSTEAIKILLKEIKLAYNEYKSNTSNDYVGTSDIISCLEALSNFSDKGIIDKLKILEDEPYFKAKFIDCIYKINQTHALEILRKYLRDDNPEIQIQTIKLIIEAKDIASCSMLKYILYDNSPTKVKIYAVKALGTLKPDNIVDELIKLISNSDYHLKGMIAWALGEIGNPKALEELKNLKHENEMLVVWAAEEAISKTLNDNT